MGLVARAVVVARAVARAVVVAVAATVGKAEFCRDIG